MDNSAIHELLILKEVNKKNNADFILAGEPILNPVLAKGVLLIAGRDLYDPNFEKTVILITEFNEAGTVGLVLNRRTKIPASEFMPRIRELVPLLDHLYIGGPVANNNISLLIKSEAPLAEANHITGNVYLINTFELFNKLPLDNLEPQNVRLYTGFAGWAPGQLESELIHRSWYIWHTSDEAVFNSAPEKMWHELIQIVTSKWVMR